MRFTKFAILEMFRRQDISYRIVSLLRHWLRGGNGITLTREFQGCPVTQRILGP